MQKPDYVDLEVTCGYCGEVEVYHMTKKQATEATSSTCYHCGRAGKLVGGHEYKDKNPSGKEN